MSLSSKYWNFLLNLKHLQTAICIITSCPCHPNNSHFYSQENFVNLILIGSAPSLVFCFPRYHSQRRKTRLCGRWINFGCQICKRGSERWAFCNGNFKVPNFLPGCPTYCETRINLPFFIRSASNGNNHACNLKIYKWVEHSLKSYNLLPLLFDYWRIIISPLFFRDFCQCPSWGGQ